AKPATMSSRRSNMLVRCSSQPWKPTASAKMPAAAVKVTWAISSQFAAARALVEPISNKLCPLGSSTKIKGTRKAGMVYFQHCMVVLYGSPPVMADAAKGDKAVGGETSDRTA